jgi:hypothetical protein
MNGPIKITPRREPESNRALMTLTGPGSQSKDCWFDLPWFGETKEAEWKAVFLSLELDTENQMTWPMGEALSKAQKLGLFSQSGSPSPNRFEVIGKILYNAVFGSEKSEKIRCLLYHCMTIKAFYSRQSAPSWYGMLTLTNQSLKSN